MIEYIRSFLGGVLDIELKGRQVKRFLKLCTCQDIKIWNIIYIDRNTYTCSIDWKDIYRTKPSLRKTRTRLKVVARKGFPVWVKFWKHHMFLLATIILILYGSFAFQQHIWHISVDGNSYLSDETIQKAISEYGVEVGLRKTKIDTERIEEYLRINIDEICWTSVYVKGTCLYVNVEEEQYNPAQSNTKSEDATFSNIYAKCDASVSSIITRSGVAQVKKGDIVKKGDLLVSGECPILDDNLEVSKYMYVNSDADIWGNVVYEYRKEIPIVQSQKVKTGNKYNRYYVKILDYAINTPHFGKEYNKCEITESYTQVKLGKDFYLPIYYGVALYEENKTEKIRCDKESASEQLYKQLDDYLEELQSGGAKILTKKIKLEKTASHYVIYGKIWTCELIGVRK